MVGCWWWLVMSGDTACIEADHGVLPGLLYLKMTPNRLNATLCAALCPRRRGLLVVARDISVTARMERVLADLTESQLAVVASLLPKHGEMRGC